MDYAKPGRDLKGRAKAAAGECPYCGKTIVESSEDHIFPQFMGGKRTIVCCKTCNDKFGFRFEAQASQWFQRLHFYLATQGLRLKVPMVRWKRAFEQDGLLYDATFEDGEAKFTLARPIVSIDRDRGILNAKFGSDRQARPVITSLLKKYGVTAKLDIEIMPTTMPKTEVRSGSELLRLAIKMCSALACLLPQFTSDELYCSAKGTRRFVGNVTYDFRTHFPIGVARPALTHLIYAERSATAVQGVVQLFGAQQYYCRVGPLIDQRPSAALLAILDPLEGNECFRECAPLNLTQPATEMEEAAFAAAVQTWTQQLCRGAVARGASGQLDLSIKADYQQKKT
jgi:hypothetical protein